MSEPVLHAAALQFPVEAVYENPRATSEFEKATGILGGPWRSPLVPSRT
jgi:hypothetical protein